MQVKGQTRIEARRSLAAVFLLGLATSAAFGQAAMRAAFVANNGNLEGSVTSYGSNPDGSLVFVQKVITGERDSTGEYEPGCNTYTISITPDGRFLATGHASSNDPFQQITILEVAADATMTIVGEYPTPDTPMDVEWLDDRYLAALRTEYGTSNDVLVYEYDRDALTLTEVDRGATERFTTSLALHPSGEYLYAGDSYINAIYAFDVNADGTLTALSSTPTGGTYPLGVSAAPDGNFLYAAGGISSGGHAILGYLIAADGTLSALAGTPFYSPGSSPKDFTFSSDSSILFAGHGSDATVRSFLIDAETGQPASTGYSFDVGIQGELGDLVVLDDYLLVTDNFYGDRGLYSFDVLPNGSFTMNGTIVDSQGIGPREIAGWSPPCMGDLDGDGDVDLSDLAALLAVYGLCAGDPGYVPEADLDGDDCVSLSDLAELLANYGQVCP
ncbi:MAG: lactonase family protein [Planctomycetes bacterium]|nr:lactonase family protein [Planctomycetota bacterium]